MSRIRSDYRFWVKEHVRFADLDLVGHVNNKSYTVYAESGRVAFLRETGFWTGGKEAPQNVIVRMELDYLRELHYPADLDIGVRVTHLGRTSFRLSLGVFKGDDCYAVAVTVHVRIDPTTRKPVELTAEDRRKLGAHYAEAVA